MVGIWVDIFNIRRRKHAPFNLLKYNLMLMRLHAIGLDWMASLFNSFKWSSQELKFFFFSIIRLIISEQMHTVCFVIDWMKQVENEFIVIRAVKISYA